MQMQEYGEQIHDTLGRVEQELLEADLMSGVVTYFNIYCTYIYKLYPFSSGI